MTGTRKMPVPGKQVKMAKRHEFLHVSNPFTPQQRSANVVLPAGAVYTVHATDRGMVRVKTAAFGIVAVPAAKVVAL
ncbi:MAG TPA: hypothetical protein VI341_13680 [Actinomycetota bacterium]